MRLKENILEVKKEGKMNTGLPAVLFLLVKRQKRSSDMQ